MLKDKRPHARLLAARWYDGCVVAVVVAAAVVCLLLLFSLSNLSQSSALPNNLKHVTGNILNVLVKLLKENEVQTEVPYTLGMSWLLIISDILVVVFTINNNMSGCLIKENEPMQMTVGATDTIATLSQWIKNEDTTDDILEVYVNLVVILFIISIAYLLPHVLQSALFALAEVCSKVEDNRKKVVDTKILDRVVQLLDSPNSGNGSISTSCLSTHITYNLCFYQL